MSSVLIVDDEPRMRELLRRWLVPAGYQTSEAPDAETALDLLAVSVPDVALCDVRMPGRDGLWLVERLREHFPTVSIVLATAVDSVPPTVSLREGVVGYVVKPFIPNQVLDAVSLGVERHLIARALGLERTAANTVEDWLGGEVDWQASARSAPVPRSTTPENRSG